MVCVLGFGAHLQHSESAAETEALPKFFLGLGTGLLIRVALQIPGNMQEDL